MTSEQRHREAHEGRLVVMDEPSKQAERLFQVTAREGPLPTILGVVLQVDRSGCTGPRQVRSLPVRNGPGLGGELPMRSQPDMPRSNEG
jgi:hypothetical protein